MGLLGLDKQLKILKQNQVEHRCQKSQETSEEWNMKDGDELENAGIDLSLLKNTVMGYYTKKPKTERRALATLLPKRIVEKVEEGSFKNM